MEYYFIQTHTCNKLRKAEWHEQRNSDQSYINVEFKSADCLFIG